MNDHRAPDLSTRERLWFAALIATTLGVGSFAAHCAQEAAEVKERGRDPLSELPIPDYRPTGTFTADSRPQVIFDGVVVDVDPPLEPPETREIADPATGRVLILERRWTAISLRE